MKQEQLYKLTRAFKSGFLSGAFLSLMVYIFARILFYEFTFTAGEEISNFFIIIASGGLVVSSALMIFLLLEMGLQYLSELKISLFAKSVNVTDEITEYSAADMNNAA